METEPHLRADCDPTSRVWRAATDWSEVFRYEDWSDQAVAAGGAVAAVWPRAEREVNTAFQLGAGRPLYRALLVRLGDEAGYCVLQSYHHGAGDGTTGMLGLAAILQRYTALLTDSGTAPPPATPRPPRPPVEQLTQQPDGGAALPRLLVEKEERARSYLPRLPFDLGELERCRAEQLPCNSSLWREGSEVCAVLCTLCIVLYCTVLPCTEQACYSAVRTRCRQEGVTVGRSVDYGSVNVCTGH